MADSPSKKKITQAESDDAERRMARAFAFGVPGLTLSAAYAVGAVVGYGPGFLVLATGALVGVIALLWASLRTLTGEAPLPEGLAAVNVSARATGAESPAERKRRVLRALKDLEHEHAVGKIDDADYTQIAGRYREDAKALMREMDIEIEPLRVKAEELVREYLAKKGRNAAEAKRERDEAHAKEAEANEKPSRSACAQCGTANDDDAAFCKKCGKPLATPNDAEASDANA